jgi:16S rRNA (guanine527-N7)-methyltransferase
MELILKYFPDLTENQIRQFTLLQALYEDWNLKINVVSRKDVDELYLRHVLHSLGIAKVIAFPKGAQVMDVGTGGGFPGIPLAILFPEAQFTLVDSIGKKIKVVDEVVVGLGLKNVKTHNRRVEEIRGSYDYIISRAVAQMDTFVHWTKGKLKNNLPFP